MDALIFAGIAALIIRTFFFEAYRIPTPSMEKTLLTGDFLVVSKIAYGPRTPMTICFPFTNLCVPGIEFGWTRLPGYSEVERNDIVVFNYPIDLATISVKTNYIKRCVGLPGDSLRLDDKILYVNGERARNFDTYQRNHRVTVRERVRLSPTKVKNVGGEIVANQGQNTYIINMTGETAETMRNWPEIEKVEYYTLPETYNSFNRTGFRYAAGFYNHDHFPGLQVPHKGQEVTLTQDNWHIYRDIVVRYEGNDVKQSGDSFVINGEMTNRYTIQQDYYFMMGDNRDNSQDSRFWGFVPQTHVVGKAFMIYFSWDSDSFLPRFGRVLNLIHDWE